MRWYIFGGLEFLRQMASTKIYDEVYRIINSDYQLAAKGQEI